MAETTAPETVETPAAPPPEAPANDAAPLEAANENEAPEAEKKADPGKLLAALTRKKAKLRAEQAALAQQRDELRAQAAQAAEIAKRSEQVQQLLARAREGDLEALEALGVRYDDLTTRILRKNTPDEKIDTLQKQLEAERKAREEHEKRLQERELAAQAEQAVKAFVGMVQGGQYPEASLYPAERIAAWGNQLADDMARARGGAYPSMQEIAGELERILAAEHARIRGTQAKPAAPAEAAAKKPKAPSPTLSNRDSAASAGGKRLSDEERDRLFAEWVAANMGGAR